MELWILTPHNIHLYPARRAARGQRTTKEATIHSSIIGHPTSLTARHLTMRTQDSARGELLRRLGRPEEARHAYRRALALVDNERRLLERRLAELGTATGPPATTDESACRRRS